MVIKAAFVTDEAIEEFGLDNVTDPSFIVVINGEEVEAVLMAETNKEPEYVITRDGLLFYVGKHCEKARVRAKKLKQLEKDGVIEWRDYDPDDVFPELRPVKIW